MPMCFRLGSRLKLLERRVLPNRSCPTPVPGQGQREAGAGAGLGDKGGGVRAPHDRLLEPDPVPTWILFFPSIKGTFHFFFQTRFKFFY